MNRKLSIALAATVVAVSVPFVVHAGASAGTGADAASASQIAGVEAVARKAVVAWQTTFVEQPQLAAVSPDLVKPIAAAMSQADKDAFVSQTISSAGTVFSGQPLKVLADSVAAEVKDSSPPASATNSAVGPAGGGGYSICVAGGARDLNFTAVSISGATASVDLTAYAWTTSVDFLPGQPARVDTAAGQGVYNIDLSQEASGAWKVTGFSAKPVSP